MRGAGEEGESGCGAKPQPPSQPHSDCGHGKGSRVMLPSSDPKPEGNRQPEMPRGQNLDTLVREGAQD